MGGVMLHDLADVLRDAGLDVHELDGWRTRGNHASYGGPRMERLTGGLVHHTGTPRSVRGDLPTRRVLRDGRAGLWGTLAQLAVGRSGRWYVIAAGLAYHAGEVDNDDYANIRCLGVECEHPGGSARWPRVQYRATVLGCAALSEHYGIRWRGHKEAAVPDGRKPDPTFDMARFRAAVASSRRRLRDDPAPPRRRRRRDRGGTVTSPYTVKRGDTLTTIARRAQTSVRALMVLNGLPDRDELAVGQRLYTRWHVGRGDTLTEIARRTGTTVRELSRLNGLTEPDDLAIGQQLRVPL